MTRAEIARLLHAARVPSLNSPRTDEELESLGYGAMADFVLEQIAAERRLCGRLAAGDGRIPLRHGPVIERDWEAGYRAGRGDAADAIVVRHAEIVIGASA